MKRPRREDETMRDALRRGDPAAGVPALADAEAAALRGRALREADGRSRGAARRAWAWGSAVAAAAGCAAALLFVGRGASPRPAPRPAAPIASASAPIRSATAPIASATVSASAPGSPIVAAPAPIASATAPIRSATAPGASPASPKSKASVANARVAAATRRAETASAVTRFQKTYGLPQTGRFDSLLRSSYPYGDTSLDAANNSFFQRGQYADGILSITRLREAPDGRLVVSDLPSGRLFLLDPR